MARFQEQVDCWAVVIGGDDGDKVALHHPCCRALFQTHTAATEFCEGLKEHITNPCRVMEVSVSIDEAFTEVSRDSQDQNGGGE